VGYGDESDSAVLELTHNWGVDKYELGNAYGHVAIAVDDAYKACEEVKRRGGKVTREAGPMKHGTTVIAFVEDPDAYKIEADPAKVGLQQLRPRLSRSALQRNIPGAPATRYFANLAWLPDQGLGEVVQHFLSDLRGRNRDVFHASPNMWVVWKCNLPCS